jgi:hypothetical protein
MSAYFPPIENVSIFDPVLFSTPNSDTNTITREEADRLYLQYPNGQGTETVPALNVNTNLFLNGTSGSNYIQFPDSTRQYTAAASQQFQPRFVNYSDTKSTNTGTSLGPIITFSGSGIGWGTSDYVIFRINQQASYNKSGPEWSNYSTTTGILVCRPYYMNNYSNVIYPTNSNTNLMGTSKKALYYSNVSNQGYYNYFQLSTNVSGNTSSIQFLFSTTSSGSSTTGGWATTIEIEYIGGYISGTGTVNFSNGTGTNNSLP